MLKVKSAKKLNRDGTRLFKNTSYWKWMKHTGVVSTYLSLSKRYLKLKFQQAILFLQRRILEQQMYNVMTHNHLYLMEPEKKKHTAYSVMNIYFLFSHFGGEEVRLRWHFCFFLFIQHKNKTVFISSIPKTLHTVLFFIFEKNVENCRRMKQLKTGFAIKEVRIKCEITGSVSLGMDGGRESLNSH